MLTSLPVLLKSIESSNESIVTGTGIECKAGMSELAGYSYDRRDARIMAVTHEHMG